MPARTTSPDRIHARAMLRKAVREALAEQAVPAAPAPAACSCQHPTTPVAHHHPVATAPARGFKAAPVLTVVGGLVAVLALLGMVTAALLAVALTALALSVVSVVLVLLVRMLRKETGR